MTHEYTISAADKSKSAEYDAAELVSSNAIRLSIKEWVVAALLSMMLIIALPKVWSQIAIFNPIADYRIPFANSDDYWLYNQLVENSCDHDRILLIGDSVVWGEYVPVEHTLTHYLNEAQRSDRFVNGGVSGTHPLALEGLVEDYTGGLDNKSVVLHCNLLWMSSPQRDLSVEEEVSFNHPRLIPQFIPQIPAYRASANERLGVIFDRNVPLRSCVTHINITDFDSLDPYAWSLENPYENPLTHITLTTPEPSATLRHSAVSWTERGIPQQDFPWVDLETSLQWQAFRRTVQLLHGRENRVFVIVGPFNEHLLTAENRRTFQQLKNGVIDWLRTEEIPCFAPLTLPSEEYADASHPLSSGYVRMAKSILGDEAFQQWLESR